MLIRICLKKHLAKLISQGVKRQADYNIFSTLKVNLTLTILT